jgi:hypothetical protein
MRPVPQYSATSQTEKAIAAFEQGSVDVLPLAAAFTPDDGAEDAVEGKERAADVGERHSGLRRRTAGVAGDAHDAAHRLRDQVEAGPFRPGPGLAEARDAGINEARVAGAERRVVDPEARRDARPIVLDDDVGAGGEPAEELETGGALQVQRDRALVAVHVDEAEAVVALQLEAHRLARLVAAVRRFDLDHVGAHVAEQHAAEGPGHHLAEVENAEPAEREGRRLLARCGLAGSGAVRAGWLPRQLAHAHLRR